MKALDLARLPYRNVRIGWTALCVWLRYQAPRWWDRRLGRDPDARDMHDVHQRNANQIFNTAVKLRGMLVKMCQVIGTRSDMFPPEYVKTLSQCHDKLPPRDYDTLAYYERWVMALGQALIQRGIITTEELGRKMEEVCSRSS